MKMNQFLNSLWPSDAIWHHRTWCTWVQVMACCLMAPSHYLNLCRLIIKGDLLWHSPRSNVNLTRNARDVYTRTNELTKDWNQSQHCLISSLPHLFTGFLWVDTCSTICHIGRGITCHIALQLKKIQTSVNTCPRHACLNINSPVKML